MPPAYQECLERLRGDAVPVDLVERRLRPVVRHVLLVVRVHVQRHVVAAVIATPVIVLQNCFIGLATTTIFHDHNMRNCHKQLQYGLYLWRARLAAGVAGGVGAAGVVVRGAGVVVGGAVEQGLTLLVAVLKLMFKD